MRIIAGDYKGRKIFEPLDKETRPLKDLTKESIFNILEHSKNVKIPIPLIINLEDLGNLKISSSEETH